MKAFFIFEPPLPKGRGNSHAIVDVSVFNGLQNLGQILNTIAYFQIFERKPPHQYFFMSYAIIQEKNHWDRHHELDSDLGDAIFAAMPQEFDPTSECLFESELPLKEARQKLLSHGFVEKPLVKNVEDWLV